MDVSDQLRIAAIVPTFNREATIGRALDSIFAQEFPASEIIVVDDGSTDGTAKLLEKYGSKIRHVYQPNGGVASARNLGVRTASAEWVAFLDSDDLWLPGHLRKMADAIAGTSGKGALYFSDLETLVQSRPVRHWQRCGLTVRGPYELKEDASDWVLMQIQPMMLQASVIRRACYLESGGLPNHMRVREDTLLFYKLGLAYPVCAVAGRGMLQLDDAAIRLTRQWHEFTVDYCLDTITMYKEVLQMCNSHRPELRPRVVHELSTAYFGAGRAFYRERLYRQALRNLQLSAATSVKTWASCSSQSLARLLGFETASTAPIAAQKG